MTAARWWERVVPSVVRRLRRPAPAFDALIPPPPQEQLLDLLRRFGAALCRAGEAASEVTVRIERLAAAYGATEAHVFVLPTGVFVRVGVGHTATADFAPTDQSMLRLDQIGAVHGLMNQAVATRLPPEDAIRRLAAILRAPPRVPAWLRLTGHAVLSAGLGLVLNADPRALLAYLALGTVVGLLRVVGDQVRALAPVLPAVAALVVTVLVHQFGHLVPVADATQLLIPPLVTFLPGAALTIGAIEIAAGSLVGGSSRMVSGCYVLLLLAFGIVAGTQLTGAPADVGGAAGQAGWWAPVLGVLVFGIGQYLYSSAPARSLCWMLLALYLAWGTQYLTSRAGFGVASGFAAGLVIIVVADFAARHHGPPAQVTFLPAFWLLVPGALGLQSVSELVGAHRTFGLADLISATLTIIAIALGVQVGAVLLRRSPHLVLPIDPGRGIARSDGS